MRAMGCVCVCLCKRLEKPQQERFLLFQCLVAVLNKGHGKDNSHTDVPVDGGNVARISHANLTWFLVRLFIKKTNNTTSPSRYVIQG